MRFVVSNVDDGEGRRSRMMLIFVLSIVLPLSTTFWIINLLFNSADDQDSAGSPTRWFVSILVPILVAAWGVQRKSLDCGGALTGLFVGFILTYSNYCFLASLLCFFVTSSKATKFMSSKKKKIEKSFKEGGQRNWLQVLCNGGMATEMALIYMIDRGCGERPVDFSTDYRGSWTAMAVLAAIACSNGDTWASEIGSVIGKSRPRLITNWKRVPHGTNGGVSPIGLLFSALGGLAVGLSYYLVLMVSLSNVEITDNATQWIVVLVGLLAGFFGSLVDSLLGATLQYSGLDKKSGYVVENPGPGVVHICGYSVLDNHSVNLISSIVTALVMPRVAVLLSEVL